MTGTAAGRDARRDWSHPSLCAATRHECIEARSVRRLEGGQIILCRSGEVAEAVQHKQNEFGVGFDQQFRVKRVEVHRVVWVSNSRCQKSVFNFPSVEIRLLTTHEKQKRGDNGPTRRLVKRGFGASSSLRADPRSVSFHPLESGRMWKSCISGLLLVALARAGIAAAPSAAVDV